MTSFSSFYSSGQMAKVHPNAVFKWFCQGEHEPEDGLGGCGEKSGAGATAEEAGGTEAAGQGQD